MFSWTWLPVIRALFALARRMSDVKGRSPAWLVWVMGWIFCGIWWSYDFLMKPVFGDGERTVKEGEGEGRKRRRLAKRGKEGEKEEWVDEVPEARL